MQSLRRIICKPRVDDWSPMAKFFYADESLNSVAAELDAFDGRRDPERCNHLVNKLRQCQDRVLQIIEEIMCAMLPNSVDRAPRDYRVKFPDDILHDNLPGQLWFGAECLAAGSNIIEHESESEAIRPLAKSLTRHLDKLRQLLRDQSLRNPSEYPEKVSPTLKKNLRIFDHLFAEFELNYVSAMVPVKCVKEYDSQMDVAVMFSETLIRAVSLCLIPEEHIENCDPSVMITLPRLAIVSGLLVFPDGPLNVDRKSDEIPEMFRPFQNLLRKIRDLLREMGAPELDSLEKALCSQEEPLLDKSVALISNYQSPRSVPSPSGKSEGEMVGSPSSVDDVPVAAVGDEEVPSAVTTTESVVRTADEGSRVRVGLRGRFQSSSDLIHRLFVCIAGVADQLQTNYPADLRAVLKLVLQPNQIVNVYEVDGRTAATPGNEEETGVEVAEDPEAADPGASAASSPGVRWIPDEECIVCSACETPFTFVRRRHHCRNCGRIFCGRCSVNALPLPDLGYNKPVRICNQCFLYKVNPFMPSVPASSSQSAS